MRERQLAALAGQRVYVVIVYDECKPKYVSLHPAFRRYCAKVAAWWLLKSTKGLAVNMSDISAISIGAADDSDYYVIARSVIANHVRAGVEELNPELAEA